MTATAVPSTVDNPGIPADRSVIRRRQRAGRLREAMDTKLDSLFKGRTFDIVREVHLPEGQVFITALGNQARHGYVLRDRATGEELAVGATVLRLIHDRYLGVSLPSRRARLKAATT